MKFSKGDKVCALLVANKWGVDFTCFVGDLQKMEKNGALVVVVVEVTRYIGLYENKKHNPTVYRLDPRVFKILPWNEETKEQVKELRHASRVLHEITVKVKQT